jgi:hypothetical protein
MRMKKRFLVLKTLLAFAAAAFVSGLDETAAQGTAFTYHGQGLRQNLLHQKSGGATVEELLAELKRDGANQITETTFQLSAKRTEKLADSDVKTTPHKSKREVRLDELPRQLQQVLRAQLRQAGDISAVIEMPDAFTLFVAREKTGETLTVLLCSIPKRSYEQYLTKQAETSLTAR